MNRIELPLATAYIEKLGDTPQNPRYHREGNVLNHTLKVLEKYYELRDRFTLTEEEKKILYWAAVLHDIGKTEATRFEKGRWTSPGHEKAGLPIARSILLDQPDISDEMRRQILQLVRWHGVPLRWSINNRPLSELKELGTQTDLRLLGIFSIFDFHGRECENQEETVGMIEKFQSLHVPKAEYELGKFDHLQQAYSKMNDKFKTAAWNAIKLKNINLLERLFEGKPSPEATPIRNQVYLTIGPPLAGKSSYLKESFPDAYHVDLKEFSLTEEAAEDDFYIERKAVEFKHLFRIYLRHHPKIVVEGRNVDPRIRRELNKAFREFPVQINYLVFETKLDEILARNANRDEPFDESLIRQQYQQMDFFHPWEAHNLTWIRS